MSDTVLLLILFVALCIAAVSLVLTNSKLANAARREKRYLEMIKTLGKKTDAVKAQELSNSPEDKWILPFGSTSYAVSAKDGPAVAFINRYAKTVSGDVKTFLGSGVDYVFGALLVRVADYGFVSEKIWVRALPLMTLNHKQNLAVIDTTEFRGEKILVLARAR